MKGLLYDSTRFQKILNFLDYSVPPMQNSNQVSSKLKSFYFNSNRIQILCPNNQKQKKEDIYEMAYSKLR
jgi:hypothetical protein